ncbi:MAG: alkylhydroperoxidase family enzyme [Acidimicrobiales bacterium]
MALEWADSMLAGGSAPSTGTQQQLRAHFSDAQIMELTYAMGSFIGFSKQLIMLGLEPEDMPLTGAPIPH